MFSLREYLTALFTLPCGAVDELAIEHGLRDVAQACQTWGREMRLKEVLAQFGVFN